MAEPRGGHAEHDPLVVAALLDPDLAPGEREARDALIASCPDCAALHADLLALATATTDLPTPARPRDFRLTAEDAALLAAAVPGEPVAAAPRLASVMTDRPIPADHAGHDPLLVASLVDHSLPATERTAAEALVAACDACADLHADLLALRDATRAMPTPARPRDYTLTAADAARLRRVGWRRLVRAFGSPRDVFSRPLAMGLTTLGLAGLLLASVPSLISTGGSTSGTLSTVGAPVGEVPQPQAGTDSNGAPVAAGSTGSPGAEGGGAQAPVVAAPSAAAAAASPVPAAAESAPAATPPAKEAFGPVRSAADAAAPPSAGDFGVKGGAPGAPGVAPGLGSSADTTESGLPLLLVVSGLFLIAGLALFAIRWSARRLGDG